MTWLYSSQGDSLEQIVLYYLGLREATLAVAESCTGGLIAEWLSPVPGSSRSFLGGAVVYSNQLKISFANVPPDLISQHGAVSEEVAKALASGIRQRTGATLGLGVTGVAGPGVPRNRSLWDGSTSRSATRKKQRCWNTLSAAREPVSANGRRHKLWT